MPNTDINLLQTKYDLLLNKVRKMRKYQIDFHLHRCSRDMENARKYQREVDDIIKDEEKEKISPQPKLFS